MVDNSDSYEQLYKIIIINDNNIIKSIGKKSAMSIDKIDNKINNQNNDESVKYIDCEINEFSYKEAVDNDKRCIEKHDHHCFWTGHCIGKNNKISFVIFIISVFCLIFYFSYALYKGLLKN